MSTDPSAISAALAQLEVLDTGALRRRWTECFGFAPPPRFRRDFLLRAVAYALQERALGGLKPATARELKRIAADLRKGTEILPRRVALPAKGARFLREWNGETQIVECVTDGYAWRGTTYPSLTAVARAITGTSWSGPAFFGLKEKRNPKTADGASLGDALGPAPRR